MRLAEPAGRVLEAYGNVRSRGMTVIALGSLSAVTESGLSVSFQFIECALRSNATRQAT
jgi:predicted amino acid dehydrogenase